MIVVTAQMSGLVPSKSAARTGPAHAVTMSPARANRPMAAALHFEDAMLSSLDLATRWRRLLNSVAAPRHARGERTIVIGLQPRGLLLLRRDLRLVLPVLVVTSHGPEHRARPGPDGRAFPGVTTDPAA